MAKLFRYLTRTLLALLIAIVIALGAFRVNAFLQEGETAAALKPDNGRFVETSLGTLHVTIWGDGNAIPVVMTHGMAAWGGLWEETAETLAKEGYRVIAVDQPPFGFSDRMDANFSRSRQAERLNALSDAMQLENYLLVGHSYGGGIAMETALRFPEKISGLVLVCPVLALPSPGDNVAPGTVPLPLRFDWLGETLVAATVTNPFLTGFLTKRFMHVKSALTERHVQILQRPMKLLGNTKYMAMWLQQFVAGDQNALSRDRETLRAQPLPVSLIWGERDTVTPIAQGDDLSDLLSPVSFRRLAETGHMPQLEQPALFNRHLLELLQEFR